MNRGGPVMERGTFDRIARSLGAARSRRDGARVLLGAALARPFAASGTTAAAPDSAASGTCIPTDSTTSCKRDGQCCSGYCKPAKKDKPGRCKCIKENQPCSKKQTCCDDAVCKKGICQSVKPCSRQTSSSCCCAGGTCNRGSESTACGVRGQACEVCSGTTPLCCGNACASGFWYSRHSLGSFGSAIAQFDHPTGIAISHDGLTAWISDTGNARISIWTRDTSSPTWNPKTIFGSWGVGITQFKRPLGLAPSSDGQSLLIADADLDAITVWVKVAGAWQPDVRFGAEGAGADKFAAPQDVALTADALTAFIADRDNNRVSIWTKSGATWSPSATFGTAGSASDQLSLPGGIAVSGDGLTAYVVDTGNNRVAIWKKTGGIWSPSYLFGSVGAASNQFDAPTGISVSSDQKTLWVSDTGNDRVSVWIFNGTTWRPSQRFGLSGSGRGLLSDPSGVSASSGGLTLLVADTGNSRISSWERGC
ncbi:MAG: NHL repeat-containing protein [Thermomicrobiales bacterium]